MSRKIVEHRDVEILVLGNGRAQTLSYLAGIRTVLHTSKSLAAAKRWIDRNHPDLCQIPRHA